MKAAFMVCDGRMCPAFNVRRQGLVLSIDKRAVGARPIVSIETQTAVLKLDRLANQHVH
jgi:hypothetical protein